jgi:hypothetical protein
MHKKQAQKSFISSKNGDNIDGDKSMKKGIMSSKERRIGTNPTTPDT